MCFKVLGVASLATFAAGLRSAWKHTRQPEAADLRRAQVLSGVGFASKALGVATVLTVSGFSLFILGVSWALNVNTPRQFGSAMRQAFGDSLRLPQSQNSQTFEELILSIEAQQQSNPAYLLLSALRRRRNNSCNTAIECGKSILPIYQLPNVLPKFSLYSSFVVDFCRLNRDAFVMCFARTTFPRYFIAVLTP
ncbi:hypothetical protein ANCCAN_27212 [Ancylostoma caninum]|uniref:Transmembrane protein 242 n=1 Tax=Ancylostoma caninum TaxID=29170 RepID=A0A368F887_ANCCA|nr:hypothetical protein ANCCAN_27212 [Ancylostoma caninum]